MTDFVLYSQLTPAAVAQLSLAETSAGQVSSVNTKSSATTSSNSSMVGIQSLNGLKASSQVFATGTSGSDFNIVSTTSSHTFNLPDASVTALGLVNPIAQSFAGSKTFSSILYVSGPSPHLDVKAWGAAIVPPCYTTPMVFMGSRACGTKTQEWGIGAYSAPHQAGEPLRIPIFP